MRNAGRQFVDNTELWCGHLKVNSSLKDGEEEGEEKTFMQTRW